MKLNLQQKIFLVNMYKIAQIATRAEFYTTYDTNEVEFSNFAKEIIVPSTWITKLITLAKTQMDFDNVKASLNALHSETLNEPTPPSPKNHLEYTSPNIVSQNYGKQYKLNIELTPELEATIKETIDNTFPSTKRMETIIETSLVCSEKNGNYDEVDFKNCLLHLVPTAVRVEVYKSHVILYTKNNEETIQEPIPIDTKFV